MIINYPLACSLVRVYIAAFDNHSCLQVLDHPDLSMFELGSEFLFLFSDQIPLVDLINLPCY